MSKINHKKRARRAYSNLIKIAKNHNEPITYGEISARLGLHHRAARFFLSVIQNACDDQGLPPLQTLVVNKQTRLPGTGCWAIGKNGNRRNQHRKALKSVYDFNWPKPAPF